MTSATQELARKNRNSLFVENGEIISVACYPGEQFIQRIRAPKCAAAARAGSFVHISCDESLAMRRPLSIMRVGDDWIDVLYKIHGEGLRLLAQKQIGDVVSVLGPIGTAFSTNPDRPNILLLGGGVGIPPMVFLADTLRKDPAWNIFAILGSEIPFPFELQNSSIPVAGIATDISSAMPLLEGWKIPSRLTSLQGYAGCFDGYVTELAKHWLASLDQSERNKVAIYACGPTPMLKTVADLAARYDLACQVSLEEFMACAVGGCAGCTVLVETPDGQAMQRVCVDGPVFDAASIVW